MIISKNTFSRQGQVLIYLLLAFEKYSNVFIQTNVESVRGQPKKAEQDTQVLKVLTTKQTGILKIKKKYKK